jgi:hypothetical protein
MQQPSSASSSTSSNAVMSRKHESEERGEQCWVCERGTSTQFALFHYFLLEFR